MTWQPQDGPHPRPITSERIFPSSLHPHKPALQDHHKSNAHCHVRRRYHASQRGHCKLVDISKRRCAHMRPLLIAYTHGCFTKSVIPAGSAWLLGKTVEIYSALTLDLHRRIACAVAEVQRMRCDNRATNLDRSEVRRRSIGPTMAAQRVRQFHSHDTLPYGAQVFM